MMPTAVEATRQAGDKAEMGHMPCLTPEAESERRRQETKRRGRQGRQSTAESERHRQANKRRSQQYRQGTKRSG